MTQKAAAAILKMAPSMNEKPMTAWAMVYGTEKPQQKPTALLFGVGFLRIAGGSYHQHGDHDHQFGDFEWMIRTVFPGAAKPSMRDIVP